MDLFDEEIVVVFGNVEYVCDCLYGNIFVVVGGGVDFVICDEVVD